MDKVALIAGVTGIAGNNLASLLRARGWQVAGVARRPPPAADGFMPIAADLRDAGALASALRNIAPTHVFITTWMRMATEAENIAVNAALVRHLFAALAHAPLRHAALVTGLKHYLGPFEAYGKGVLPETPFRETMPRLPVENFYYAQEDELFAAADKGSFSWSVHRPHTIIGQAIGNAMNMGSTLAVYATICRETGRPFVFPGSPQQWSGLVDVTDARQLARHLAWAATAPEARNEAFNIVNGDIFRWSWMWERIASWFGIAAAPYPGRPTPLSEQLADGAAIWSEIAARHRLVEPDFDRLASPWHSDADLGRPIEVVTDMSKSRVRGFLAYQPSDESFFDVFAQARAERLIP